MSYIALLMLGNFLIDTRQFNFILSVTICIFIPVNILEVLFWHTVKVTWKQVSTSESLRFAKVYQSSI